MQSAALATAQGPGVVRGVARAVDWMRNGNRPRLRGSIKSHPKETASLGRICQFCLEEMWADVEAALESLAWQCVRIHRDDILEARGVGPLGTELKRLGDLTLIDAVKQMAVVDQEAGAGSLLAADLGEHQVKAEDLHVGDALAALSVDVDVEQRTVGRFGYGQAARAL